MTASPLRERTELALELLLGYDLLSEDDVRARAGRLPAKLVRWLAINHPDNRTRRLLYEATGVSVGEGTVLNAALVLYDEYRGLVSFGKRVAVAHNVTIVASSWPNNSRLAELPEVRERLIREAPVRIDDDAWLGTGAIIMPGVTVGRGAVVGAGAVVLSDVDPYTVVAGVPARLVRRLDPGGGG
jgi:acetyltransferase-like isoleucine patch superfamily enzyme